MIIHMINKNYRYSEENISVTDSDKEQLEKLFAQMKMQSDKSISPGRVTRITDAEVWVDIGAKSEGVLPLEEFNLKGFGQKPMVDDTIEVWVQNAETTPSHKQESVNISFARAAQVRSWWALEQSYKNKKLVSGIILNKIPGGYIVSILPYGARGFLPLSQADPQISRNNDTLQRYKNEMHQYLIVRMERNLNIILSRREAMFMDVSESNTAEGENKQGDGENKSERSKNDGRGHK
jgi:small subunit ribosomal protein S1